MLSFPHISPEILSFELFGFTFALRWYAVSYILGFICALQLMKFFIHRDYLWPKNMSPLGPHQADSILTYLILGVIVGGRLGYVLFYNLDYYILNPLEIIQVWDGGMAFHGGFLGVIVAVFLYSILNSINLWSLSDLIAVSTPPGLFFGRLANFVNSELWGRPTTMPWGVVFPGAQAQDCKDIIDICARHPSQLYEALLEGALLLFILLIVGLRAGFKKPGFITGLFFFGYGVSRFFVEFYRVPDPQFFSTSNPNGFAYEFFGAGITMGQSLSLPMIIAGVFLVIFSLYSKEKL